MKKKIIFESMTDISSLVEARDPNDSGVDIYDVGLSDTGFYKKLQDASIVNATVDDIRLLKRTHYSVTDCKTYMIDIVKDECNVLIIATYPYWKQLDIISAGGADKTTMDTWITDYRGQSDTMETAINGKTTLQQLVDYVISWTPPT